MCDLLTAVAEPAAVASAEVRSTATQSACPLSTAIFASAKPARDAAAPAAPNQRREPQLVDVECWGELRTLVGVGPVRHETVHLFGVYTGVAASLHDRPKGQAEFAIGAEPRRYHGVVAIPTTAARRCSGDIGRLFRPPQHRRAAGERAGFLQYPDDAVADADRG